MHETNPWDYLIITAANDQQARSYEFQLRQREIAGELPQVRHCLVIPDIDGKRIGSGGSTLHCLTRILEQVCPAGAVRSFDEAEALLRQLRILIVHAGGDSRRLPAYSHCGKMFVPIPGKVSPHTATTLFDRLIPAFLSLPAAPAGQVVVASGDALILFDASSVDLSNPGITALGLCASPEEASHHGVFCAEKNGSVRRFLQKPRKDEQAAAGAMNEAGKSVLDLGVMNLDASAAVQILRTFLATPSEPPDQPGLVWKTDVRDALFSRGIDLYREICCALGTDTSLQEYVASLGAGRSTAEQSTLAGWYRSLRQIRLSLQVLSPCKFLHFGTTWQLITSGHALLAEDSGTPSQTPLILNSRVPVGITSDSAWIEGCSIEGPVTLEGFNTVVGLDIFDPLRLPRRACLDAAEGMDRHNEEVWFLRCYAIDDSFKLSWAEGGTFCGMPLSRWLSVMGVRASDIWPPETPVREQTLWNARVFPAEKDQQAFRNWLWLFEVESATPEQKSEFLAADRYSSAEIAVRVDPARFHARRSALRSNADSQSARNTTSDPEMLRC
jgi:fucokinase